MCTASFSHGSTPMRGHPPHKFPPAPEPLKRLRRFSLEGNLPQGKQKFLTEGLTIVFACCIVSYTSNEPHNQITFGGKERRQLNGNLNDSTSIYLQIAAMLEDNIVRDLLLEEEQAPSTNELAKAFSINPATAAKGLNLLVDEGILYKKRGIGMFVAAGSKQKIIQKRKDSFFETYVRSLVDEARTLAIGKEELMAMIEQAAADKT